MTGKKSILFISSTVTLSLLFVAITLQTLFGTMPLEIFRFPVNLYLILELATLIIAFHLIFKKSRIIRWLSSSAAAISSILLFSILIVPMAIIPQHNNPQLFLGLDQMTHTWMFACASLFLITTLGFTLLRRSFPLRGRNILFFINHFGLWMVLTAGLLGAADRQELTMQVYEGQVVWYGKDEKGKTIELPLAIKLQDFVMRSFPPKMALINSQGKPYPIKGNQLHEITGTSTFNISKYQISIGEYLPEAQWDSIEFINRPGMAAVMPAARVTITTPQNDRISGWISSGNYMQNPTVVKLGKDTLLALLSPEPEYFGSKVTLYAKSDSSAQEKIISVNNPAHLEGWSIYQYSYDMEMGNDSKHSVFMLVKDPWLPLVYFGMILLMIGSVLLLFTKTKAQRKEETV
jgi:hypothetical protein